MSASLGKYQLIRELGSGAMGVVWEAIDTLLERRVAIKILSEGGEISAVHIREAAVAARVNHPNAVAVYDAAEFEGCRFIVMELVAGPNAGRLVAERGRLPWAEATRIARDAASGLAAIHSAGLIHRDVKPGNILIAPDGSAKVADFGLAKRSTLTGLTKATGVVGTPHYMSPEQCWSELADARAEDDLFVPIRIPFKVKSPEIWANGATHGTTKDYAVKGHGGHWKFKVRWAKAN